MARSASLLPPGPRAPVLLQTLGFLLRTTTFLEKCTARYGAIFTVRTIGFGTTVIVSDPDGIREIFAAGPEVIRATHAEQFRPLVGASSLFMLHGEPHQRQRRRLMPAFHREHLQGHGALIAEFTNQALDSWPLGRPFSAHRAMRELSLQLLLRIILGCANPSRLAALTALFNTGTQLAEHPAMLVPLQVQEWLGGWSPWSKILQVIKQIDELLYAEIRERHAAGLRAGPDILSVMMFPQAGAEPPMAESELRDQIITLLVAAHDTTATTLTWALHWLLQEPELLERLQREVRAADETMNPPRVTGLPLLEGTVRETLRLSPVFPVVGRRLTQPLRLLGYELPAGIRVVPCAYLAQRRSESFPSPQRFCPERFVQRKPSPSEWFPFGGGFARCVGMELALYQMKVILATILGRATLAASPGSPPRPILRFFSLIPSGGLPIILRARRPLGGSAALVGKPAPHQLDLKPVATC